MERVDKDERLPERPFVAPKMYKISTKKGQPFIEPKTHGGPEYHLVQNVAAAEAVKIRKASDLSEVINRPFSASWIGANRNDPLPDVIVDRLHTTGNPSFLVSGPKKVVISTPKNNSARS